MIWLIWRSLWRVGVSISKLAFLYFCTLASHLFMRSGAKLSVEDGSSPGIMCQQTWTRWRITCLWHWSLSWWLPWHGRPCSKQDFKLTRMMIWQLSRQTFTREQAWQSGSLHSTTLDYWINLRTKLFNTLNNSMDQQTNHSWSDYISATRLLGHMPGVLSARMGVCAWVSFAIRRAELSTILWGWQWHQWPCSRLGVLCLASKG